MAIFRPKPSQIFFFGLVPKSPIHIGWIYVKNPKPNISCLGPFKDTYHSNHTVIERLYGQSTLPACTVCSKKLCFAWIDVPSDIVSLHRFKKQVCEPIVSLHRFKKQVCEPIVSLHRFKKQVSELIVSLHRQEIRPIVSLHRRENHIIQKFVSLHR